MTVPKMDETTKWKIRQNLRARIEKGRSPILILEIAKVIIEDEVARSKSKIDRMTEELTYIKELTPAILEEKEGDMPDFLPAKKRYR